MAAPPLDAVLGWGGGLQWQGGLDTGGGMLYVAGTAVLSRNIIY
jgi:hypothetical protein